MNLVLVFPIYITMKFLKMELLVTILLVKKSILPSSLLHGRILSFFFFYLKNVSHGISEVDVG